MCVCVFVHMLIRAEKGDFMRKKKYSADLVCTCRLIRRYLYFAFMHINDCVICAYGVRACVRAFIRMPKPTIPSGARFVARFAK